MKKRIMRARWEGMMAAIYGHLLSDCPYPAMSPTETEWRCGYRDGARIVTDSYQY